MVHQILESLVSNVLTAISWSYHKCISPYLMSFFSWENDHQRSKKSPLTETDAQMAPIHLFLFILIVFVMICIMKDAQWHLAQNLSFRYAAMKNN